MALLISIVAISIIGMLLAICFFPKITIGKFSISTFWIPPLIGALFLLIFQEDNINDFFKSLVKDGSINPLEILALFFSMTFISVVLDEVGFFEKVASMMVKKAKANQNILFILLYFLTSFLTIFTSNDIIIITFTPFIIFFSKSAKIDPLPYLISEFVAANTWSMIFIIGNPTNVYLASSMNVDFFTYFTHMFAPTICAGVISFSIMYLLFRKRLKAKLEVEVPNVTIKNKPIFIISLSLLIATTILMAVSSFIGISMWIVCVVGALILLLFLFIYALIKKDNRIIVKNSIKRLPYSLVPFLLSMFVIVMSLNNYDIINNIVKLLNNDYPILSFGISGFLTCNVINNIPMSVLYSSLISNLSGTIATQALYASVIASNVGAFFTPLGALAGIMWMSILKKYNIKLSFVRFVLYGAIIAIPTLLAALAGLVIY